VSRFADTPLDCCIAWCRFVLRSKMLCREKKAALRDCHRLGLYSLCLSPLGLAMKCRNTKYKNWHMWNLQCTAASSSKPSSFHSNQSSVCPAINFFCPLRFLHNLRRRRSLLSHDSNPSKIAHWESSVNWSLGVRVWVLCGALKRRRVTWPITYLKRRNIPYQPRRERVVRSGHLLRYARILFNIIFVQCSIYFGLGFDDLRGIITKAWWIVFFARSNLKPVWLFTKKDWASTHSLNSTKTTVQYHTGI